MPAALKISIQQRSVKSPLWRFKWTFDWSQRLEKKQIGVLKIKSRVKNPVRKKMHNRPCVKQKNLCMSKNEQLSVSLCVKIAEKNLCKNGQKNPEEITLDRIIIRVLHEQRFCKNLGYKNIRSKDLRPVH